MERALIGRDAELEAGRAALERVLGGRGALLLFSGAPLSELELRDFELHFWWDLHSMWRLFI